MAITRAASIDKAILAPPRALLPAGMLHSPLLALSLPMLVPLLILFL